jgi:hypothetical protein
MNADSGFMIGLTSGFEDAYVARTDILARRGSPAGRPTQKEDLLPIIHIPWRSGGSLMASHGGWGERCVSCVR